MTSNIRVAVADDHALFRQGLKSLLSLQPDITIVSETDCAEGLSSFIAHTPCDILLLDLQMERSSLGDIEVLATRVPVIVVTASEQPDDALDAVRFGARGVVFKRFAVETLIDAIRTVAGGEMWLPPSLQGQLAATLRCATQDPLTPREREVIRYVALGLRNAEVGKKLFISEQTVKTHLNNVFQKLGVRDRVELTRYAIRVGIVGAHERGR